MSTQQTLSQLLYYLFEKNLLPGTTREIDRVERGGNSVERVDRMDRVDR